LGIYFCWVRWLGIGFAFDWLVAYLAAKELRMKFMIWCSLVAFLTSCAVEGEKEEKDDTERPETIEVYKLFLTSIWQDATWNRKYKQTTERRYRQLKTMKAQSSELTPSDLKVFNEMYGYASDLEKHTIAILELSDQLRDRLKIDRDSDQLIKDMGNAEITAGFFRNGRSDLLRKVEDFDETCNAVRERLDLSHQIDDRLTKSVEIIESKMSDLTNPRKAFMVNMLITRIEAVAVVLQYDVVEDLMDAIEPLYWYKPRTAEQAKMMDQE
jgi:hypothetical protein